MKNLRFHSQFVFRFPKKSFQNNPIDIERIREAAKTVAFQEAIYVASPALFDELMRWVNGELKEEREVQKIIYSLYKYYSRMSSRCTPYGLFASCATGSWGEKNEIIVADKVKRLARLDMNFVCALTQKLAKHSSLQSNILFYPNSSIYPIGEHLRYVEYRYINNKRIHNIASVDQSEYLSGILSVAKKGAKIHELINFLTSYKIPLTDASSFIQEIIDCQLLISEIESAITGENSMSQLLSLLKKANDTSTDKIIYHLENIDENLKQIDTHSENEVAAYRQVTDELKFLEVPFEENQLLQVDCFAIKHNALLDKKLERKIVNVISFLNKIHSPSPKKEFEIFKTQFFEKYESREMPLLELLDTESGIGYPAKDISGLNNLVDEIQIPKENKFSSLDWNPNENFILKMLLKTIGKGEKIFRFTEEDVNAIPDMSRNLSPTLSVMFKMINVREGKIQLNYIGGGSSAANLLGRFAYGDVEIHNIVKDIVSFEQKVFDGKIMAEIVHLPEGRIGNILSRPVFREYEIPYLGKSGASIEKQILLEDLMLSVKNNRIVLRSKRLNKEIIPRLSTAHNYRFNSLPVYKFLCDLQLQDIEKPGLGFSWGALSSTFTFLPRAEYNDVIISPATWNLSVSDFSEVAKQISSDKFIDQAQAWKVKWGMPRYIVLKDGDNELLVDFENELSIKVFFNEIRNRKAIEVSEFLFDPENALVRDEQGRPYTNEIIATVFNHDYKPSPTLQFGDTILNLNVRRDFIPGSDWLYYKIYCGVKTADDILASTIKSLVEQFMQNGLIGNWFFIRYADPDTHIRLRFYNHDISKLNQVSKIITEHFVPLHEQRIVSKIQSDTYSRELERYGHNTIELAEKYFAIDSYATLLFLNSHKGDAGEEMKWKFAMKSVDELMDGFRYSSSEKLKLTEKLKRSFIAEHSTDKNLKVQLDTKFRKMRSEVNALFDGKTKQSFTEILNWKKNKIQPIADEILKIKEMGELEVVLDDLLASYMHMKLNRIFKAKQRTHEMVIYDMMYRYYKSEIAKVKHKQRVE